jgi:predicted DNA-binding protein (MmcQ/YjbR family)
MASRARSDFAGAEAQLRSHALAKPEATEHFPWGERAIKVKGKVFLFMRADATQLSLSTKLPQSSPVALLLPFAQPTGYGLGKAGWVSASFEAGEAPPTEMLCAWIDESYQAVAPSKLAALARGDGSPSSPTAPAGEPKAAAGGKAGAAAGKAGAAAGKAKAKTAVGKAKAGAAAGGKAKTAAGGKAKTAAGGKAKTAAAGGGTKAKAAARKPRAAARKPRAARPAR